MRRWILWTGLLSLIGVLGVLMFVRGSGISADRKPWPLEERLAKAGWRFLVLRDGSRTWKNSTRSLRPIRRATVRSTSF